MTEMRFVDTNILLYRVSMEPAEEPKQKIASSILSEGDITLSVQVLQEFYVQATRPNRVDALTHEEAVALIRSWRRFPVLALDVDLVENALAARDRWQLSYWDAAILEAARASGCDTLLSEDLNSGQLYDGIEVLNPFI